MNWHRVMWFAFCGFLFWALFAAVVVGLVGISP